jgi:lactoylglutathione lyase
LEKMMTLGETMFTIFYVDDVNRATAFYRDIIGLPLAYSARGWVQFGVNGNGLVLHPKTAAQKESPRGSNQAHLALRVADLDAEYERLSANHVRFAAPPSAAEFGKHATFLDVEGNEIDLLELRHPTQVAVTANTLVNDIVAKHPEAMEVFENHGIRICGGCLVLLNAPVYETAEYSGLSPKESTDLLRELNEKLAEPGEHDSTAE